MLCLRNPRRRGYPRRRRVLRSLPYLMAASVRPWFRTRRRPQYSGRAVGFRPVLQRRKHAQVG